MMNIWHKRNEFPHGFIDENKLFVYVFDDGVDVTEYCEQYHKCSNLKKWCVFNELVSSEKKNKALQEKLEIAVNALNAIKQAIEFGFPKRGIRIDTPHTILLRAVEEKAQEALEKIKDKRND